MAYFVEIFFRILLQWIFKEPQRVTLQLQQKRSTATGRRCQHNKQQKSVTVTGPTNVATEDVSEDFDYTNMTTARHQTDYSKTIICHTDDDQ